jgi:hypothetical protein
MLATGTSAVTRDGDKIDSWGRADGRDLVGAQVPVGCIREV